MRRALVLVAGLLCMGLQLGVDAGAGQGASPSPLPAPHTTPREKTLEAQVPALPTPTPAADVAPKLDDVTALKIQNGILKANLADRVYRADMAAAAAQIQSELEAFETKHPGWTIDVNATPMKVVKKTPPKK